MPSQFYKTLTSSFFKQKLESGQFEPVQSESLTSVYLLLSATLILLLPNRQVADLENGSSGSES
jgi:hypothetical protein